MLYFAVQPRKWRFRGFVFALATLEPKRRRGRPAPEFKKYLASTSFLLRFAIAAFFPPETRPTQGATKVSPIMAASLSGTVTPGNIFGCQRSVGFLHLGPIILACFKGFWRHFDHDNENIRILVGRRT